MVTIEHLIWIGIGGAAVAFVFVYLQRRKVLMHDEGTDLMKKISAAIREGANAYLKRQYKLALVFFAGMFLILSALAYIPLLAGRDTGLVNPFIPFAFITGGFFTTLSGFIGMKAAVAANARTANAAKESLNKGLRVAFSSGSVMGFTVAGMGLLDIALWYIVLTQVFGVTDQQQVSMVMLTFGMGVGCASMFARIGGGIFTKAADVGADLVGKVEVGIPEDDPRNPAVIADNVGDNVGDVAGMGADLFESYANAIIASFAIGVGAGYGVGGLLLPIFIATLGIIASIIGVNAIRTKEQADQKTLLKSLHKGTFVAGGITALGAFPLTWWVASLDGVPISTERVWGLFAAIIIGLVAGFLIGLFTEYYTSDNYKPTKKLAESCNSGSAMVIIGGLSLGLKSTFVTILTLAACVMLCFLVTGGLTFFQTGTVEYFYSGLFGVGVAAVGMLATLGVTLASDAFGPVADNAGGIAEMAKLPAEVRKRTDALDALGNTTAATGKGFAIGSTAFTAIALLVSYVNTARDQIFRPIMDGAIDAAYSLIAAGEATAEVVYAHTLMTGAEITHQVMSALDFAYYYAEIEAASHSLLDFGVTNPSVLVGLLVGGSVTFVYAALTIAAVNNAAQSVVQEVRRQFREIKGLMTGTAEPEYAKCVDICTRAAQKEMIAPVALVIAMPLITGVLLGVTGVVGYLAGIIVTGTPMAIFMLASGGAWDNAKKHIEAGNFGGKGSEAHKNAVVGDTVGDPFKDTAGPCFNLLIPLSATVSIVFVGIIIALQHAA